MIKMIKETVSIDEAIALLNEILQLDPEVANIMVKHHFICNEMIANHATIQVQATEMNPFQRVGNKTEGWVGILGVINGMFGVHENGMGPICYEINKNEMIVRFKRTEF
jgi:hypothetical protein